MTEIQLEARGIVAILAVCLVLCFIGTVFIVVTEHTETEDYVTEQVDELKREIEWLKIALERHDGKPYWWEVPDVSPKQ